MNILDFLSDPEWDAPFFKRLANNDTSEAKGKVRGLVLPKELRRFLPVLDVGLINKDAPTVDRRLDGHLYLGMELIGAAPVRYQLQTRTNSRSPESRMTAGLWSLLSRAKGGDVLILQRRIDSLDRLRFVLLKQGTPAYREALSMLGTVRWGPWPGRQPIDQQQVVLETDQALTRLESVAAEPFRAIADNVQRVTGTLTRIARDAAFRFTVRVEYRVTCAISGIGLSTPGGLAEVQAAHVVPLWEGGADDVRNGIALTSTLHWAFDRGMIGVLPRSRRVHVPKRVMKMPQCTFLKGFAGRAILEARTKAHRLHDDALDWHLEQMTRQWGK